MVKKLRQCLFGLSRFNKTFFLILIVDAPSFTISQHSTNMRTYTHLVALKVNVFIMKQVLQSSITKTSCFCRVLSNIISVASAQHCLNIWTIFKGVFKLCCARNLCMNKLKYKSMFFKKKGLFIKVY